ncbi:zinc finger protein 658B-like isoform X4 [Esox lucius]|uniref:zinc finger protein 658B-like isoform X4 n=1 Tax=Esox lucius TaxID=8010 RepID=UPI001476AB4F|nr:zinc finger protein 658B-like isoform X4 [Esox lucius]
MEEKPSLLLSFHTEPKQESLDSVSDSKAQCSLVDSEMTSVKQEDCSQTLGLNNIKCEEEEKNIGDVINQEIPGDETSQQQQHPEDKNCDSWMEEKPNLLLSFHTEPKQESLDSDCDSKAQCSLVDSEMTSVKQEDCSQTLGLNNIKCEEKIVDFIKPDQMAEIDTFPTSEEQQQEENKDTKSHHCPLCEKCFLSVPLLKRHINIHTGEKHSCSDCGKSYSKLDSLK